MGVPSAMNWDALAQRLREGFFRKPFLKNNRSWVRQLVIADPEAFAFLAPHIKLELIVNGHLRYWDGWGNEITRDENNPLDFLKDKMVPHLLEFLLGDNAKMFTGILNFC